MNSIGASECQLGLQFAPLVDLLSCGLRAAIEFVSGKPGLVDDALQEIIAVLVNTVIDGHQSPLAMSRALIVSMATLMSDFDKETCPQDFDDFAAGKWGELLRHGPSNLLYSQTSGAD